MSKSRVGVLFGGRSVEHEISVLTALQVVAVLKSLDMDITPIYIAKSGVWYSGVALFDLKNFSDLDSLVAKCHRVVFTSDGRQAGIVKLDVKKRLFSPSGAGASSALQPLDIVFPLVHGSHGEDGTLQGLLEMANIAYVGPSTLSAALGMDKILTKVALRAADLPVLDYVALSRRDWVNDPERVMELAEQRFEYPVFVKPVTLGSSIGVNRATDRASLEGALATAFTYDSRVMIEPSQENVTEVNCAVLGDGQSARASVVEQPIGGVLLSYDDKYAGGGKSQGMKSTKRLIPAPLTDSLTAKIQQLAIQAFNALQLSGVTRVDFLVYPESDTIYINELNTIPGSLSFYLWEPAGLPFDQLLRQLMDMAVRRHTEKQKSTYSFDSIVLREGPSGGAKSRQGAKAGPAIKNVERAAVPVLV